MMYLTIRKIPTGKMLFLVGEGGDGKSMDAILERTVFGENNCATLDSGVFTERSEFRKSAHVAWNKLCVRI